MSADRLLDRLDRVKKTGAGRWLARCPAHEDRGPSLSVRELDDGRTLVHCFGGCEVSAVLGAVSLDFEDLFPPRAVADHVRRERKPYSVRDLIVALEHELTVAWIVLSDVAARRPTDPDRAALAAERIASILGELQHAG